MPTKPTDTFLLATNEFYATGPFVGDKTKEAPPVPDGYVPGVVIAAENHNYIGNICGQWISNWLDLGTFNADLDAHIVETDASGATGLAVLTVGGTAAAATALSVSANSGSGSAAASVNNSLGGFAIIGSTNGASAAIRGTCQGTAPGVEGLATGGSGPGVRGTGGTSGAGGSGGEFSGGGTDGHGIEATATNANGSAAVLSSDSGSSSATVQIVRTGAVAPVRGLMSLDGTGDPSAPAVGDLWRKLGASGFGRGAIRWYDEDGAAGGGGPGQQTAWSTTNGLGYGYADSLGDTAESTGTLTTKVGITLGVSTSPGLPAGDYIIEYSGLSRITAGLTSRTQIEFFAGGVLVDNVEVDYVALFQKKSFFFQHKISLPAGGINALSIRFFNVGGVGTSVVSQAKIVCRGAYEA